MRGYDDDEIRAYTPILQRIIILAAVMIAVPAMMWTITTFVRSYVGRPQVPTLQRMTEAPPAEDTPDASRTARMEPQAAAPPLQMADASPSSDNTRTALLEIKKPAGGAEVMGGVPAPIAAPAPAAVTPAAAAPAAQPMTAAPVQVAVPAQPKAAPVSAAPVTALPPSVATSDATVPPTAADRAIVWPNPQSNAPPDIGTESPAANGTATAPPASDAAAEDLPAVNPIAGPVPLPRHRPNDVAMLQTAAPGAVPLPRARPVEAPADSSATSAAPLPRYEPGMETGHY